MQDSIRTSQWTTVCQLALSHGAMMAKLCRPGFSDLITHETQALCDCEPPTNENEYNSLLVKSQALTSKIGLIAHGSSMAQFHQRIADELLDMTKHFCETVPLDDGVFQKTTKLIIEIGNACHRDTMERSRGL